MKKYSVKTYLDENLDNALKRAEVRRKHGDWMWEKDKELRVILSKVEKKFLFNNNPIFIESKFGVTTVLPGDDPHGQYYDYETESSNSSLARSLTIGHQALQSGMFDQIVLGHRGITRFPRGVGSVALSSDDREQLEDVKKAQKYRLDTIKLAKKLLTSGKLKIK